MKEEKEDKSLAMPGSHGMLKDNMRKPFTFLAMNNVPKGKGWL